MAQLTQQDWTVDFQALIAGTGGLIDLLYGLRRQLEVAAVKGYAGTPEGFNVVGMTAPQVLGALDTLSHIDALLKSEVDPTNQPGVTHQARLMALL